jgi:uncharacterized protein
MQVVRNRIILDTNLLISYLISNGLEKLDYLILNNQVVLLYSQELIEEFIEVSQRAKFKKYFSNEDVLKLLSLMRTFGELVEIESNTLVCRDIKDNFLLSLAKDGKADCLLTGDDDLLDIKIFEKTRILTYNEFLSFLTDSGSINLEDLIAL